jgi:hypothetical protein
MLRVTIELVPFGIEEEAREIGKMVIANDGSRGYGVGDYAYAFTYTDRPANVSTGTIKNFTRSLGAWSLVKRILNKRTEEKTPLTERLEERL